MSHFPHSGSSNKIPGGPGEEFGGLFFFHCNYLRLNNGYITAKLSSILFIQSFLLRRCFLLSNKGKSLTELLLQNFPLIILVGFFSMCYQMYNKRKSLISSIRRVSLHHESLASELIRLSIFFPDIFTVTECR